MKQLLAAVDFSKNTDAVLAQAASFAKALEVKLWILHVASDETQAMAYESTPFSGYSPEFINMPGDVQLARNLSADEIKRITKGHCDPSDNEALIRQIVRFAAAGLAAPGLESPRSR